MLLIRNQRRPHSMSDQRLFSWDSPNIDVIAEDICNALTNQFDQLYRGKFKTESFAHAVILCLFYIKLRNDATLATSGTYKSFKDAALYGNIQRRFNPSSERELLLNKVIEHNKEFLIQHSILVANVSQNLDDLQSTIDKAGLLSDIWISENVGAILEVWLSRRSSDPSGLMSFQPKSLTDLIVDLTIDLQLEWRETNTIRPIKVYNPFSGLSSYPISINRHIPNLNLTCQELDTDIYYLSVIRLFCNDFQLFDRHPIDDKGNRTEIFLKEGNKEVVNPQFKSLSTTKNVVYNSDTNTDWIQGKFDFIICSPPIGSRNPDLISNSPAKILERSLDSLEKDGLLGIVLGSNSEHRSLDRRFREIAVESGFLKHVVRLPGRTLKETSISITAYLFQKTKSKRVQFTDLSEESFYYKDNRGNIQFNIALIKEAIVNAENQISVTVDSTTIVHEGYILSPLRYVIDDTPQNLSEGSLLVPLKRILKDKREPVITKTSVFNDNTIFITDPIIRVIKELHITSDSVQSLNLSLPNQREKTWRKMTSPGILITSRGSLIARAVDPELLEMLTVYVDSSIRIYDFSPELEIELNIDFLLWKLNSPGFQNRKRKYESGNFFPVVSARDLLEIKIEVPPVQFQLDQIKELSETTKVFQASIDAANRNIELLQKSTYSAFSDFAHFRHSMAPKLLSISSIIHNLSDLFKQDTASFNTGRQELGGASISNNLEKIRLALRGVNSMLDDMGKSTTLLDKPHQIIGINEFVMHCFSSINFTSERFPSIIRIIPLEFTSTDFDIEVFDGLKLSTNLDLISILCENIFKNAHDHAYTDSELEYSERMVALNIEYTSDHVYLTLKNNGSPFKEEFQKSDFISKGVTTSENNTGLGGFDVNRIASYLGSPDWILINNAELEFPVQFKFEFPILKD